MAGIKSVSAWAIAVVGIAAATPMFHHPADTDSEQRPAPVAAGMFGAGEATTSVVPATVAPLGGALAPVRTVDTNLIAATFASLDAAAGALPDPTGELPGGQGEGGGMPPRSDSTSPPLRPGSETAVRPGPVARPAPSVMPAISADRATLEKLVSTEAARRGVPLDLARAHVTVESEWNPRLKGPDGKVGLMQVRPAIARIYGYKGEDDGLWEPATNVRYGMMFLAGAWKRADGDLCRTAMKIVGGHYVETMKAIHVAYCERLQAALPEGSALLAKASTTAEAKP